MKKGWELKTLGEVCDFVRGLTYSKKDEVDFSSNVVLRSTNIDLTTNKLDLNELKFINDDIVIPENKKVSKGSLFICTANGSKSHLGKVALIDDDYDYAFGGFMGLIKPRADIAPKFLYYLMISENYKKFISELSDGANINNLKFKDLSEFQVVVPPINEQQRIVAILDEAFAAIDQAKENVQRNLQNAKELFQSELNSLSYTKEKLGNIVSIVTGKLNANEAVEGGNYPFFTCSREVFKIDKYAFDTEAILLAGNNAVGDFNVKHYKGKFNAYQRTYVITVKDETKIDYRFLYYQMEKSLIGLKSQSVGAGTKFLKLPVIQNFEIDCPSLDLQKKVVKKLDSLSFELKDLQNLYQHKLDTLEELKKSILRKAFNGELTVAKELEHELEQSL